MCNTWLISLFCLSFTLSPVPLCSHFRRNRETRKSLEIKIQFYFALKLNWREKKDSWTISLAWKGNWKKRLNKKGKNPVHRQNVTNLFCDMLQHAFCDVKGKLETGVFEIHLSYIFLRRACTWICNLIPWLDFITFVKIRANIIR